ncbi:MAG: hypothetical protein C5B50_22445 [Verrucomicrobia bacterium]|nr:MAG: hypothetical protein C5B50_22445 [Verrucomicrobiota bacterium]
MPRKIPISEREVGISARLREFRRTTGLSRVAFAQKAGIDSSILVRYEHGRVPLKYVHAWRLIRTFFINPAWLATGEGGRWTRGAQYAPGPELLESAEGELFSEVYDRALSGAPWKDRAQKQAEELSPSELRARYEWAFQVWVRDRMIELPDKFVPEFTERLKEAGSGLLKKYGKDSPAAVAKRKGEYQADLQTDVRLRLQGTI